MITNSCTYYKALLMWLLSETLTLQGMLRAISAAVARQEGKCWRDAASQTHDIKSFPASDAAQLPELNTLRQTLPGRLSETSEVPERSAQRTGASARDEKNTVRQPQRPVAVDSRAEQSWQGLTRSHSAPLQSSEQRSCAGQTASPTRVGRAPAESDSAPPQPAEVQHAAAAAKHAALHNCNETGTPSGTDKQACYSRLSRGRQMKAAPPPQSSHMQTAGSVPPCSCSEGRLDESALPVGHASKGHRSGAACEERAVEAHASMHASRAAPEAAQLVQHVFTVCVQSLKGLNRLRSHGAAPGDACHISYTIPGRSLGLRLARGTHVNCWCMCPLTCCWLSAHRYALDLLQCFRRWQLLRVAAIADREWRGQYSHCWCAMGRQGRHQLFSIPFSGPASWSVPRTQPPCGSTAC